MTLFTELSGYVVLVVMGIVPIANPFSSAPLFISMTARASKKERGRTATLACIYMAALLLVFLLFGTFILQFFGISISSLRMAGGLVIAFMGFRMLFPEDSQHGDDEVKPSGDPTGLAFTPLAMPMLAGPGSISVVLAMAAQVSQLPGATDRLWGYLVVGTGIGLSAFICWLVLHSSGAVVRVLGQNGIDAMTKLMGFILICIGVEFVFRVLNLSLG